MAVDASKLVVRRLSRISPSRYSSLRNCALREVLASAGNDDLLPRSPVAILGSISHKLLEIAGRGSIPGDESEIQKEWDRQVEHLEQRMHISPLEGSFVPLRQHVRDYDVRRSRSCIQAAAIATSRASSITTRSEGPALVRYEQWIQTEDGLVGGYADRIARDDDDITITDYKTGAIFEKYDCEPQRVKPEYATQLKLYALCYRSSFGAYPFRLELVGTDGTKHEVPFTESECEALGNEARSTLREVNSDVDAILAGFESMEALASPNPSNCSFCTFRADCSAYWKARQQIESDIWPGDVSGTVVSIHILQNGRTVISMQSSTPEESVVVRGFKAVAIESAQIKPGDNISIYNLREAANGVREPSSLSVGYRQSQVVLRPGDA